MKDFILYDCDTGADDAIALMMLLGQSSKVKTVGVTCVDGNTSLENVVMNNLRVLKLFNKLDEIPLFKGCSSPLLSTATEHAGLIHGSDGLGGQPDFYPSASPELLKHVQDEHAANAIVRLSKEYEGQLKIVATGPLTNLALAFNLDPDLPSRLSSLYVMGGTRHGHGNVTPAAEFNFYSDPEAAYITLHRFSKKCPVHLIDFEFTLQYPFPWDRYDAWFLAGGDKKKASFAKMALTTLENFTRNRPEILSRCGMSLCDAYAMAIAIDSSVGLKPESKKVCVELAGFHSRGMLIVDRANKNYCEFATVTFYHGWNEEKYEKLLQDALS